jgi:two-component system, cell cycle response regulator
MSKLEDTTVITTAGTRQPCEVLIVDDDELVLEQLAALLQVAGYNVSCVQSGAQALRHLDEHPCSIMISDWEMPDMDGVVLTRNVRQRRSEGYVYILLLTVRGAKRDVVTGLQAGADDYLPKGASTEELLARLETARRITILEQSLRSANRENRRLATTDALTGVRNRRYLMKYFPREYERSRRYGHLIAILAFDLDRFKLINDNFGHDAGDDVLREFCGRCQSQLRACDWMARSGGEEFIVVLPETDLEGARALGERIRVVMEVEPISTCVGVLPATVSIGVAAIESSRDGLRLEHTDLLRTADECLYLSKNQGRNRVTASFARAQGGELRSRFPQLSPQ